MAQSIRIVNIQGLYYVNPITKECFLVSDMMLCFKNSDEIIHFLLKKILRKKLVFDYADLKRALKVRG
jgi:hypothetical protein